MDALISIIVPIYKVEQYLDECLTSIVTQTYQNLEIILVDDGSPDNCPAMCDAWVEKDSRIKVIHQKNAGVSAARNAGFAIASGEFLAFVDGDDYIKPEMYAVLLKTIRNTGADLCACNVVLAYENSKKICNLPPFTGDAASALNAFYKKDAFLVSPCNKLYHRSLLMNTCFPLGITCGEDAYAAFRILHCCKKIVQIDDALYFYRIRRNSAMTTSFRPSRMDEIEVWRKNYEFISANYPSLKKSAFDFYLLKVNVLLKEIPANQRKNFPTEYKNLRTILKKNLFYLLFYSNLSAKQRIRMLLDYCTQ